MWVLRQVLGQPAPAWQELQVLLSELPALWVPTSRGLPEQMPQESHGLLGQRTVRVPALAPLEPLIHAPVL